MAGGAVYALSKCNGRSARKCISRPSLISPTYNSSVSQNAAFRGLAGLYDQSGENIRRHIMADQLSIMRGRDRCTLHDSTIRMGNPPRSRPELKRAFLYPGRVTKMWFVLGYLLL